MAGAAVQCSASSATPAKCLSVGAGFPQTLGTTINTTATRGRQEVLFTAEAKTKPTPASVEEYLASKASPEQLSDCKALMALLRKVTMQSPKMWGPSIVGYGSYGYKYESGSTGESCLTGFALRGKEFVVYLLTESQEQQALLSKLGKHKMGKACLYFKRLADLDATVLESLVSASVSETKRSHTVAGGA